MCADPSSCSALSCGGSYESAEAGWPGPVDVTKAPLTRAISNQRSTNVRSITSESRTALPKDISRARLLPQDRIGASLSAQGRHRERCTASTDYDDGYGRLFDDAVDGRADQVGSDRASSLGTENEHVSVAHGVQQRRRGSTFDQHILD